MSEPRSGPPAPATSPWRQHFEDYVGRAIDITVTFDEGTREISGGTVHRDEDCLFSRIILGIGPDETPETSPTQFEVPVGDNDIPLSVFADLSLATVEDVQALQITAGL